MLQAKLIYFWKPFENWLIVDGCSLFESCVKHVTLSTKPETLNSEWLIVGADVEYNVRI